MLGKASGPSSICVIGDPRSSYLYANCSVTACFIPDFREVITVDKIDDEENKMAFLNVTLMDALNYHPNHHVNLGQISINLQSNRTPRHAQLATHILGRSR